MRPSGAGVWGVCGPPAAIGVTHRKKAAQGTCAACFVGFLVVQGRLQCNCSWWRCHSPSKQRLITAMPSGDLVWSRLAFELRIPLELVQSATDIFSRYSDGEGHTGTDATMATISRAESY